MMKTASNDSVVTIPRPMATDDLTPPDNYENTIEHCKQSVHSNCSGQWRHSSKSSSKIIVQTNVVQNE